MSYKHLVTVKYCQYSEYLATQLIPFMFSYFVFTGSLFAICQCDSIDRLSHLFLGSVLLVDYKSILISLGQSFIQSEVCLPWNVPKRHTSSIKKKSIYCLDKILFTILPLFFSTYLRVTDFETHVIAHILVSRLSNSFSSSFV